MNKLPRARREKLVIQEMAEEVLVYDLERDQAHCLNQTAAMVWKHCDGESDAAMIAGRLTEELRAPVDERMVWFALEQLGRDRLLEGPMVAPATMAGMTRRQMVRTLGVAAVVAVPLITTIVAPTPAQAATCFASGVACTSSAQCCSGLCNSGPGTCQ
ncbi:MAG: PqqD family protein [Pyrinomonadaceae bacterium]